MYVHIGKSHSVWVQLAAVIVGAVVLGSLVCAAASARWRWQDRAALRKPSGHAEVAAVG